jgi:hypothetical protein
MKKTHFLARREKGQSLAEFAATLPLLILFVGGIVMACFYGFRSTSADWGLFINGVAAGSYDTQVASEMASRSVTWPDIRSSFMGTSQPTSRSTRTWISVENARRGPFGADIIESYRGSVYFRLWRFYAGPPMGGSQ